jgi:ferredoxin
VNTERITRRSDALAENMAGDFFVDSSCIDCDLCRQIAPAVFARGERIGQSYVAHQPASGRDQQRALMALVTCPTSYRVRRNARSDSLSTATPR